MMARVAVLVAMLLTAGLATGQTPDQQYAFADSLHQNGEDSFAMLEFKRFIFHNPGDAKAPDAFYRLARLYVSHLGDIAGARRILAGLRDRYPGTQAAKDAAAFTEFIEVHSDFQGEPLKLWLLAESFEKQKAYDQLLSTYDKILTQYPQARLADDALLRKGIILRDALNRPADGHAALASLGTTYPKSDLRIQADYEAAVALSRVAGRESQAAAALRSFAAANPNHALAEAARKDADALERRAFVIKRQFDAAFVKTYAVRNAGTAGGVYKVDIEVPVGLSERDVQATLEDALVKEAEKRAAPRDKVAVTAYVNYPISVVGDVAWTPGEDPSYRMREQQTSDRVRDVFIDILRRR